jgi:hypothetical protein
LTVGQCRLCLQDAVNLSVSHFISAAILKILRDDGQKNPNPWLLTKRASVQTSWQMKAPLLCGDCEDRFSKNGETWVIGHCLRRDGSFPLASVLASRTPDVFSNTTTTKLYFASKIPEINVSALAYFAASMFWRGSIHPWNSDGSVPVKLGPFQEQFRQYLLGIRPFPMDCTLSVVVREGKEIDRLTWIPYGQRVGKIHIYKFPMPGLAFSLIVSKNIPTTYREKCFVHGHENPIVSTNIVEKFLMDGAVKMRHLRSPESRGQAGR